MSDEREMMEATLAYCRSHECLTYDSKKTVIKRGIDQPVSGNCELSQFCLRPVPTRPSEPKHHTLVHHLEEAYAKLLTLQ